MLCLAVLGLVVGGATAVYAAFSTCPRCKSDVSNCVWKCQNCGIVYCHNCSTLSDKDIAEGKKPHTSCSSSQCPSCRESKGKQIQ